MQKRILVAVFVTLYQSPSGWGFNAAHLPATPDDQSLEYRVIDALSRGTAADWQVLRRELDRLGPFRRNELPFRVGARSVDFVFEGVYPHGMCDPGMLEYAVSFPDIKDHETLLVIQRDQTARLAALNTVLAPRRVVKKTGICDVRITWEEGNKTRTATIAEILHQEKEEDRAAFAPGLEVNDAGIGSGRNFKGDRAKLPGERVRARVYVGIAIGN